MNSMSNKLRSNELSVEKQIKAIESWSTSAYEESRKGIPETEKILGLLKNINSQGKTLEWRSYGLKSLPSGKLRDNLKKKISELRAAAMSIHGDIRRDLVLSSSTKRLLRLLASEAVKAVELIKGLEMTISFQEFIDKPSILEDFFEGEGNFSHIPLDIRRDQWNSYKNNVESINLLNINGADLSKFDFSGLIFSECKFIETNFNGSLFVETSFWNSEFKKVSFIEANLSKAKFLGWVTLKHVSFASANLKEASFGFVPNHNYRGEINITDVTFESANCERAKFTNLRITGDQEIVLSFRNANLRRTKFIKSGFENIPKTGKMWVSFEGADVKHANFHGHNLDHSGFKGAKNKEFTTTS